MVGFYPCLQTRAILDVPICYEYSYKSFMKNTTSFLIVTFLIVSCNHIKSSHMIAQDTPTETTHHGLQEKDISSKKQEITLSTLPFHPIITQIFSHLTKQEDFLNLRLVSKASNTAFFKTDRTLTIQNRDLASKNSWYQTYREWVLSFIIRREQPVDINLVTQLPFSSLILPGCKLSKTEAKILAQAPNLHRLDLSNNKMRDEGATPITHANWFNLTAIKLSNNKIGNTGAIAIAHANWPKLTHLWLDNNQIGDHGAIAIANNAKNWPKLTQLCLNNNQIGDDGARAIANNEKNWPNLTHLGLSRNQIGDDGILAIAHANWPELTHLFLHRNQIGNLGIIAIAYNATNFPKLTDLVLDDNLIGGIIANFILPAAWPKLDVTVLNEHEGELL
eukprot:gene312-401_t